MIQSNQVLDLRCQLWPFVIDVFPHNVPGHCAKATLVVLLRPVGQPYPALESIQSSDLNPFSLELSWHHRHSHGQPHEFVLVLQLKLRTGLAYLPSVDGPRVEEDHIPGLALNQLSFSNIRIVSKQLQPVAFVVRALVPLSQVALSLVIVGVGHDLKSACPVGPHIDQRNHALHALKSLFVAGVLVDVQVLDKGIPSLLRKFVPPWPPADESVETSNQRISIPYFTKDCLDLRPGAQVPGGVRVAAAVGNEEADGPAARPVVVDPSSRVAALDATAQSLHPLPEIVRSPLHFLLLQDIPDNDRAVVVQIGDPASLVLELKSISLQLTHLYSQDPPHNQLIDVAQILAAGHPHPQHPLRRHDGQLRDLVHGRTARVGEGIFREDHPAVRASVRGTAGDYDPYCLVQVLQGGRALQVPAVRAGTRPLQLIHRLAPLLPVQHHLQPSVRISCTAGPPSSSVSSLSSCPPSLELCTASSRQGPRVSWQRMIDQPDHSFQLQYLMQWCCPDKEIDEAYGEEYRRAVYLNSVGRTPGDSQQPLKSVEEQPTHNNSYKQLPPQNTRISRSPQHSVEIARTRNGDLGREIERRKITLWTHTNRLVERSDMLRQTYVQKNSELQGLCREIDRHFA